MTQDSTEVVFVQLLFDWIQFSYKFAPVTLIELPLLPGGPRGPRGPCGPCSPIGPWDPFIPFDPLIPGGPGGPGGPWGSYRNNKIVIKCSPSGLQWQPCLIRWSSNP